MPGTFVPDGNQNITVGGKKDEEAELPLPTSTEHSRCPTRTQSGGYEKPPRFTGGIAYGGINACFSLED